MKIKILYLILGMGLLGACNDFLDVKPVGKFIPTEVEEFENLLNNPNTVEWQMMDNNRGSMLGYWGDNLYLSPNIADWNYNATHPNVDRYAAYVFKTPYNNPGQPDYFWEWGYRAVGLFNNVIDGTNGLKTEKTASVADGLNAQARIGRAWVYLTLGMIYGPVYDPAGSNDTRVLPYRTSGSPTDPNPDLATTAEIFELAKADIEFGLTHAPDLVGNPSRANKCVAQTMMAYYYMFTRDYAKMLEYADMAWQTALRNKGSVEELIYNYNDFKYRPDPSVSPSPGTDAEAELELESPDGLLNQTYHRENLFYRVAPYGGTTGGYPSSDFLSLFDQQKDMRYRLFALKALGYAKTENGVKYDDGVQVQYFRDSKMTTNEGFTYPELLLMRAEAYARTHHKAEALEDLNTLRRFRYSGETTDLPGGAALTEDQLLEEILKERRREQPIATYQRALDLKRLSLDTGKPWCKTTIEHRIGDQTYSAQIQSEYFILPVPNNIIEHNPHWGLKTDDRPYNPK